MFWRRKKSTSRSKAPRRKKAMATSAERSPRRPLRWLGVCAVVAGVAAGAWGVTSMHTWVAAEPQFRVAALEVRGLRLLSGDEILHSSGVQVGEALLDVDLDAVAARLDSLVWVKSVRIERKPPDRLVVHLQERRRLAWIEWQGRQYGIDADGVLLPPDRLLTEGIADLDLPVLRVPSLGDSLRVGTVVADSTVQRLVAWWQSARKMAPELTGDISQVEPFSSDALRLRLVADNLEVRLPYDDEGRRLATLREILGRVYGECPNPAYIDLRFAGQAIVGRPPAPSTTPDRSSTVSHEESRHG